MPASATRHLLDWLVVSPTRPQPDPSRVSRKEWDALLAQAVAHTTAPQLFRRLSERGGDIPPQVMQCAFVAMMKQKPEGARLERQLPLVLRCLNDAEVETILLKGAHLSSLIYPEPSHRPMADLDLMVRVADLQRAEDALKAIGYTTDREQSIADHCTRGRHIPPLVKDGTYPVEIHWTLADPTDDVSVDVDGLWARSRPVTVYGEPARALSVEDVLLYICLHAVVVHQFDEKGLRPLLDVLALLERNGSEIDWPALEARSHEWRISRAVYLMLEIARRYGGANIPENVLADLRPAKTAAKIFDAACEQMFELPNLRLHPVRPRSIALAVTKRRFLSGFVFGSRKLETGPKAKGQMKLLVSRYGGFVWNCIRSDRHLLRVAMQRTWRHIVLSTWLAKSDRRTAVKAS